jgi:hypothetical protein
MTDKNKIAESILTITGLLPHMDRLMDEASQTIDGEYGNVDDEELEGVCYSHIALIDEGKVALILTKNLTSSEVSILRKIAGENLDLGIERDSWGSITLSLQLEVPSTPNAKDDGNVYSMDIEIRKSGAQHIVKGIISDDDVKGIEKSLTLFSLMG